MNKLPDKNRRILVIDDNRAIHDDFRKILSPATAAALDATETALFGGLTDAIRQTQFEVDSAYQGQEGVLLVKKALEAGLPYAMAFVDIRMPPGWDGVETTQKIWAVDPEVQIVLCTAYSDYSWDEMFEKLGHRDGLLILKKPFDTVEASQLANALTEKWWLHQQSRRKMEELEGMVAGRTQELAKSLSLLNATLESTTDGIVAVDLSGKVVSYNTKFATIWQLPAEMLARRDAAEMRAYAAEQVKDSATFLQRINELQADPEAEVVDVIELKDGRTFERYIFPQRINQQCVGTVINWRDITERKRAEVALMETSALLETLLQNTTDKIYFKDLQSRFVHFSREMLETFHLTHPDELKGRTDFDFFSEEHARPAFEAEQEIIRTGKPALNLEEKETHRDGRVSWVSTSKMPWRDKAGKVIGTMGISRDITERQRAEEKLRESERRFSDMLRNLELVSIMSDRDARITYCNDYLLRLTGWSREEVIGRDWFELLVPPERVDELRDVNSALLADQPVAWHHENEILTRSGGRRLIRWNNSVLRSASGDVIGTASIGEDITEHKRLEAQLFQSQKMESVGKLAGGVAHEFNSILTAIIGQSELLLGDLPAGSPLANNATEISKAAGRAATLTRQLLAYGRKQFLQPETLDLNRVIASMEGMFDHLMGGGVDTQIVPAPGLRAVKADAGQIEQVIMNLAINARDAMPNGGKLTLETANVSFDHESVGRYPELKPGDYVMLAITDTGTGMSEEVQAHVFEPFFTTKGVGQGTGLGLSTCYGIIKQSGGQISVYSELARGTTFKIYLPQVEQQTKIPIQRLDPPDLPRGTETILLVEDDPALREMAATLLRRLGYKVLAAANGIEALSLKQQRDTGHIDLLFTDVVMPHMSGKELADRVRALYPHTRILFASAYTENAIVHQGVLNKGVALLQKPFTPSALAHKLREVLDQPGAPEPDPRAENI